MNRDGPDSLSIAAHDDCDEPSSRTTSPSRTRVLCVFVCLSVAASLLAFKMWPRDSTRSLRGAEQETSNAVIHGAQVAKAEAEKHREQLAEFPNRVCLYAEFTAKHGEEARVKEMINWLGERVRAEPGCLVFESFQTASNPRHFFVFETYKDVAAFKAHISAPHGATFNNELVTRIENPKGSDLTWLAPTEVEDSLHRDTDSSPDEAWFAQFKRDVPR